METQPEQESKILQSFKYLSVIDFAEMLILNHVMHSSNKDC